MTTKENGGEGGREERKKNGRIIKKMDTRTLGRAGLEVRLRLKVSPALFKNLLEVFDTKAR